MKTIIAGSRNITDQKVVDSAVASAQFAVTEVVSGGARGVDRLGEVYAAKHNLPLTIFPADWEKHGKSAGHKRNAQMAEYADSLIAIWDGKSPGTRSMIDLARKKSLALLVVYKETDSE